MKAVPEIRLRACNALSVREEGSYVLYWMIAYRRLEWNFALDRAVEWSERLRKPLVILEALRCSYPWASDRIHSFILDGMTDNALRLKRSGVLHYPFCEFERDAGKGLLQAMAAKACVVVTDDYPCFFLPHMVTAAAAQLVAKMEAVDSNGLLPMRAADRVFPTAHSFRRFLQKNLRSHLTESPRTDSIGRVRLRATARLIPREVRLHWASVSEKLLHGGRQFLLKMPIDHKTGAVPPRGGATAARTALRRFLRNKLDNYLHDRNEPEQDATSGLSPYLHFGHISAHQIFSEITKHERWGPENMSLRANGSRTGWWGVGESAEAFLDQLITWRELGFNFCSQREDYDKFSSLPAWATKTLKRHARDERAHVYSLQEFESARTHDALWNAAQNQLVREGRMHNYLRMLWGKKILEWSGSPQEALEIMIELNNKYALDGRDPNSYSGIFWCLGRYDRPWGPERPIFGTVRYMSSENTARKFSVKDYIRKYSP